MVDTEVSKSSASRLAGSSPALSTTILNFFPVKFSLDNIITEYESLETELMDPTIYADLARLKATNQKKKSIQLTVELYREYKMLYANYDELKTLVTDEKDPEMLEMMKSEIAAADKRIPELEEAIKIALLPKDPNDSKNIILEVRA
jgi:peptide chain release factor 1